MRAYEATSDHFCMAYPVTKGRLATLQAAKVGKLQPSDPFAASLQHFDLVDENLEITDRGRWKLVAELGTVFGQADLLAVPYDEVGPAADPKQKPEDFVVGLLHEQGHWARPRPVGRRHSLSGTVAAPAHVICRAVPLTRIELPGSRPMSACNSERTPMSSPCRTSMCPPCGQPSSRR